MPKNEERSWQSKWMIDDEAWTNIHVVIEETKEEDEYALCAYLWDEAHGKILSSAPMYVSKESNLQAIPVIEKKGEKEILLHHGGKFFSLSF